MVAYADPATGHSGSIYKAAGFQFDGGTKPSRPAARGSRCKNDRRRKKRFVKHLQPSKIQLSLTGQMILSGLTTVDS
jgi:hypothetical protein